MQPQIVERKQAYAVGLGKSFAPQDSQAIKALWDEFSKRAHEIESQSEIAYGVCAADHPEIKFEENCCMVYVAAKEAEADTAVPPGMVKVKLESGAYARFTHRGPIDEIGSTVGYIWGEWQPQAPYQRRSAPDFELYDHRFDPASQSSEVDIYVPLERIEED
ncbi:MAG: GyrI-like domain-containing protein [Candidatus Melainabacteria bacterium]|nr:GyrI-like domain-containing protein [Candidatus Melainabacteria bacterium]